MNYTGIAVIAALAALCLFGVAFGLWSLRQRLRVRKLWKSFARDSKDAKYLGGIISHPRLELSVGDIRVLLILATYRSSPDRVVVHLTSEELPADFAVGRLGVAHKVGRAIAGQGGGHRVALDHVAPGWTMRSDDRLFLERCAEDRLLGAELSRLCRLDPDACVEWQHIKYSTEDYPTQPAELLALVDVGLGVATPLKRLCRTRDDS